MKRHVAFLVLLASAVLFMPRHARAQETPASDTKAPAETTPDHWVKRLSSERHEERARASKALEDLGAAALPALRTAAEGDDAVAKDEALRILERIDRNTWLERLKSHPGVMEALKKLCAKKLEYKPGWTPPWDGYKPELNELEGALKKVTMPYARKFKLAHGTFCLLGHFGAEGGQLVFVSAYADGSIINSANQWGAQEKYPIGKLKAKVGGKPNAENAPAVPSFELFESALDELNAPPGASGTPVASLASFDDLEPLLSESKPSQTGQPREKEQPAGRLPSGQSPEQSKQSTDSAP